MVSWWSSRAAAVVVVRELRLATRRKDGDGEAVVVIGIAANGYSATYTRDRGSRMQLACVEFVAWSLWGSRATRIRLARAPPHGPHGRRMGSWHLRPSTSPSQRIENATS
jgi:hypothetical protein